LVALTASCGTPTVTQIQPVRPIQPEGIPALLASFQGEKAVLVNVWATWCVPCVEEFPYLVELRSKYKDQLEIVFISTDFPEEMPRVNDFLAKMGVDWQTYVKEGKDEPFILAIHPDWTGAMPATAVYDKNGALVTFFEQPADYQTFETHILNAINR
jgi:thiol-disulfide isomerase/thioredoxin